MVTEEQFVAISHKSLKKYLDDKNNINFRFTVNLKVPILGELNLNFLEEPNKKVDPKTMKSSFGKPADRSLNRSSNISKKNSPALTLTSSGWSKQSSSDSANRGRAPSDALNTYKYDQQVDTAATTPACFSSANAR